MENGLIDRAAKAILATRAPGLSRPEWARKAAEAVIGLTERPKREPAVRVRRPQVESGPRGTKDAPIIVIRKRVCPGWIGTFDDGSLRIGVTKDGEEETRAALGAAVVRCREILALPWQPA